MKSALKIFLALLVCATVARAQDEQPATLKVGDAAPALAGGKWVKGEPIDKFDSDKIYVVEFWATWCGPCIAAIPHVSEMQKTYAKDGLIVIGQNVWENDQAAVEPFVTKMGDKMDYRVRMDDLSGGGRGKMAETWMQAAGQNGIPCSFLIGKDGKIAWIGHPMELEGVLKQVIAGTFDPKKAAAEAAAKEEINRKLSEAMRAGDHDKALAALDEFEKANPELAGKLAGTRFGIYMEKKDYDNAYKAAAKLADASDNDPEVLNQLAWFIATEDGIEKRDLDLAEKFATKAVEKTERKNPAILDTLARIQFDKGQVDKAIATQTEALGIAPDDMKAELKEALDKYQAAKK